MVETTIDPLTETAARVAVAAATTAPESLEVELHFGGPVPVIQAIRFRAHAADCRLTVEPATVDFGAPPLGLDPFSVAVRLNQRGVGPCPIRLPSLEGSALDYGLGFEPGRFDAIGPGETLFVPLRPAASSAAVVMQASFRIEAAGASEPQPVVVPTRVEWRNPAFSLRSVGGWCSDDWSRRLRLEAGPDDPTRFERLSLTGPPGFEFLAPAAPFILRPGEGVDVDVAYDRRAQSASTQLFVEARTGSRDEAVRVALDYSGLDALPRQVDRFQNYGTIDVDLLVVLDGSGSFERTGSLERNRGPSGHREQPLAAALAAIERADWLRPSAVLSLVVVTDEDDQSPFALDPALNSLLLVKGFRNTNRVGGTRGSNLAGQEGSVGLGFTRQNRPPRCGPIRARRRPPGPRRRRGAMTVQLPTGPTRCLLVRPEFLEDTFYNLSDVFRTLGGAAPAPPLGALIAAALLPESWELRLVDAEVEPLTDDALAWADIVMVSGIGPQQETIQAVLARARALGKTTVVGGAAPTLQPEKFTDKADFVVAGEAETTIPKLLEDLERGAQSGSYFSTERADITDGPVPRYDLCKLDRYLFVGLGYNRGCPFACEFCALTRIFGKKPRSKSVEQVLRELGCLYELGYRGVIDFGYDNLIGNPRQAELILEAVAEWSRAHRHPFCFTTEATMNLARQPRILQLMQECDFRYVFMGIESADEEVLRKTHKVQNTVMPPEEVVRTVNAYGIVVNTGLILGFDGETEKAPDLMLRMIERTAAFPTLILALHALPNTDLAERLAREGRLFGGGIDIRRDDRTDTATTGLNFVTSRPRAQILADLARVLEEVYHPRNHYRRVAQTVRWLGRKNRFRPPLKMLPRLFRSFLRIALTVGLDRETGPLFWRAVLGTALTKPAALEVVIGQAVFNWNYRKQAMTYVRALREDIALVERDGEARYNADRLAEPPTLPPASA